MFNKNLKKAIEGYKNKKVTLGDAAKIANLSYREFLEKIEENNIPLNIDTINIDYGLESIKKSLKK